MTDNLLVLEVCRILTATEKDSAQPGVLKVRYMLEGKLPSGGTITLEIPEGTYRLLQQETVERHAWEGEPPTHPQDRILPRKP